MRLRYALYLLAEKVLTWCVHPYLRARILKLLGASVGANVRVYEARFFNLMSGFRNLTIENDAHIGIGCLLDLTDRIVIGRGAVLSPGVTVLTHADAGTHHDAPVSRVYPRREEPTIIGAGAWVGARAVLLCGAHVGENAVVGANSVVVAAVPPNAVVAGSPARAIRPSTDPSLRTGPAR